jgi:hypothetical protein
MTPARWLAVKRIVFAALEVSTPDERERLVERMGGGDAEVVDEVRSLLDWIRRTESDPDGEG